MTSCASFFAGRLQVAMTLWLGDLIHSRCLGRLRAPSGGSVTRAAVIQPRVWRDQASDLGIPLLGLGAVPCHLGAGSCRKPLILKFTPGQNHFSFADFRVWANT